jgi:hypothetical protein
LACRNCATVVSLPQIFLRLVKTEILDDFYANRYKSGKGRKSRKRDMKKNNNMEHETEREKKRRQKTEEQSIIIV